MSAPKKLSVIVPLAPGEMAWKSLLHDLKPVSLETEILLVSPDAEPVDELTSWQKQLVADIRWISSPMGRAIQQNRGALSARGEFLLFLHADSKLPRPTLHLVFETMKSESLGDLFHFDLQFLGDGPKLVHLNSLFANWRSRYLKMPFGDQGFLMSRRVFDLIGGFPENCEYGEDHALVWEARRKRIPVRRLAAAVFTSARKYQKGGWGRVTRKHVWLTTKQAVVEGMKLVKSRIGEV